MLRHILIFAFAFSSLAAKYTDAEAIHAIAGEARGESFQGQVAIGEAIRNRGTLKGVYGLNVPMGKISKKELQTAALAWSAAAKSKTIGGATGWGTDTDWIQFRKHKWFKNAAQTVKIGAHTFYKLD